MSLLDEARNAPTRVFRHYGRGIGQGITSESHRVEISTEARDALVELADRVREWCASEGIETTGITVAVSSDDPAWAWARMVAALGRLQR